MGRIFVGNSEYRSLRGKPQYLEERAGLQFLAVLAIVNAQLPASERVTFNECERPRASQLAFWNDYRRRGAPPAAVAAVPYTSKHDGGPTGANATAADLGGPGGTVISDRAHALVKLVGAPYGIHHTGAGFRPAEKWHFQYVPGTAAKLASLTPTALEREEEHMTARLYRHSGTGTIAIIDPTTGYYWALPGPAYVDLVKALGIVPNQDATNIPANQFEFLQGRVTEHRQTLAAEAARQVPAAVWAAGLTGWNGVQPASARLVGADSGGLSAGAIDQVAIAVQKKLPVGSGGSIDTDSLAAKIVAGVKALFTKAGS